MDNDALCLLRRSHLFAQLAPADLQRLIGDARPVDLAEGTFLCRAGEPAERLYFIVSGEVETVADGPPTVLRLGPGDVVGIEAILTRTPHDVTARATCRVSALPITAAALMGFLEESFQVAIGMISAMAAHLREQVREITELKMQSTAERLAGYLVSLAGEANGRAVVKLPCEKRLLAENLGMDPATLSRAFAKLRDRGVVASRTDKVVIDDVSALRSFGACAATA
ncbi:MAG: Crp/Fnr family transcriptional regulator [Actinomycetota bacterium]